MSMSYRFQSAPLALALLLSPTTSFSESFELKGVADGVYAHPGKVALPDSLNHNEIANIGFITGKRCVAVIDTGGNPEEGRALRHAIEKQTSLPVCYVINTHVHGDHVLGNSAFRMPGVHFVGHYRLPENLAARAQHDRDRAARDWEVQLQPEDFVLPDMLVQQTLTLDLGERTLQVQAWPTAHTSTDITILDTQTSTLWLGDLLFMDHLPVVDGNLGGWLQTLSELGKIQAVRAIPGHGPVSAPWPQAMDSELHYLHGLKQSVRHALDRNATLETAMDTAGQDLRDHWQLFDQYHKRNVAAAFAAMEWEDN
ncbi:MAG: hypothetical protein RIQ52_2060 [Pseudomonadota bacterium]|jgi:quinoprotein relay system zinc metallohydrolase 2